MKIEIIKIIEAALKKNESKIKSYSSLLADNMEKEDPNFSKEIRRILNNNSIHPVYFDDFLIKPKDEASDLEMVDVIFDSNYSDNLVLEIYQNEAIETFIKSYEKRDILMKNNVDMEYTFLFYGEPGTGKTALAHLISKKLNLPLVVVKLDAVISSLLGNTAKNIRKVFDYANSRPCVLFLDEFDAIAKIRDDARELGELKRVVNSLLQNIDSFSKNNILLAATNHEQLLDSAIWRRFTFQLNMNQMSLETKFKIFENSLHNFRLEFNLTDVKRNSLKDGMENLTPSEIKKIGISCIRKAILNEKTGLSYFDILYEFYLNSRELKKESIVKYLSKMKLSRQEISVNLEISIRQVDNELKKGES